MNKENIKRMKVLDDETIDKDPVDGDLLTRDIVHYVGKKPKGSINQFEPVQQSRQDHSCLDQIERVHECITCWRPLHTTTQCVEMISEVAFL